MINSAITGTAPRSALPKRLSASSNIMSFLPPSFVLRYSPLSENVLEYAPLSATDLMASPVRWSEAFISINPQPYSFASASAQVVLPTPGVPISTTALFFGMPLSHDSAHALRSLTGPGFPSTSFNDLGLYFSVQSSDMFSLYTIQFTFYI